MLCWLCRVVRGQLSGHFCKDPSLRRIGRQTERQEGSGYHIIRTNVHRTFRNPCQSESGGGGLKDSDPARLRGNRKFAGAHKKPQLASRLCKFEKGGRGIMATEDLNPALVPDDEVHSPALLIEHTLTLHSGRG